jgi:hypothetical protein
LWVQQAVRSGRIDLRKIAGEVNPADIFTKHSLSRDRLMSLTGLFDCQLRGGRAASAPETRTAESTRTTMAEAHMVAVPSSRELFSGLGNASGGEPGDKASERSCSAGGGTPDTRHPACVCAEPQRLCLPHVAYNLADMNALYPPFVAPPAVDAGDPPSQRSSRSPTA